MYGQATICILFIFLIPVKFFFKTSYLAALPQMGSAFLGFL